MDTVDFEDKIKVFKATPEQVSNELSLSRFMNFSPDRIKASANDLTGVDISHLSRPLTPHAGTRKHSTQLKTRNPHAHFGSGCASDTIEFETSMPFGFRYLITFLDLATKYLAVYFLRTQTMAEVQQCYQQYTADYGRFMKLGYVELWVMDNGKEFGMPQFFKHTTMDGWLAEYKTRRRFIVPWNPQMNPAESSNRILLRPIRAALANANMSTRLWPFAAHQAALVHNILCTLSDTAVHAYTTSSALFDTYSALWEHTATAFEATPLSPFRMMRGVPFNAKHLHPVFCRCDVLVVNPDDLRTLKKASSRVFPASHLGLDDRRDGYFVFINCPETGVRRFTTSAYKDTYFNPTYEATFPPLSSITGWSKFGNNETPLPSLQEQRSVIEAGDNDHRDALRNDAPRDGNNGDLMPPIAAPHAPHPVPPVVQPANDPNRGVVSTRRTRGHWNNDQCEEAQCSFPRGHSGPHSNWIGPDNGRPSANLRQRNSPPIAAFSRTVPPGYVSLVFAADTHLILKTDAHRPLVAPNTTTEAFAQDEQGWREAYRVDFEAKMKNGAFTFEEDDGSIPRSSIHSVGWAHKHVYNDDNTLESKRARLVGRPYKQLQGRDYESTYTATPSHGATRFFLAVANALDLDVEHCDVVKAFTQNELNTTMHAYQPVGIRHVLGKNGKPMLMRIIMALEGLKQSGNIHQTNHSATFIKFGWKQSQTEPCIFFYIDGNIYLLALVLIDDCLFGKSKSMESKAKFDEFMIAYALRWDYKSKGPVKHFNGVTINRDRTNGTLSISNPGFITGIYEKYVPSGHPQRSTPCDSQETMNSLSLATTEAEKLAASVYPFLAALASLIWYMCSGRPDICFMVSALCQFMHSPSVGCWTVLVDLISYCYHSRGLCITYNAKPTFIPKEFDGTDEQWKVFRSNYLAHAYVDGSWKIPSIAGFVFSMFGGTIDWSTQLVKVICHSSAETEVAAGSLLCKKLAYYRSLSRDLKMLIDGAIPVFIDSTAAMDITSKLGVSKRTQHFLRWQHYLRWMVQHLYVRLIFVSTKRQMSDALTKVVDKTLFLIFRSYVMDDRAVSKI